MPTKEVVCLAFSRKHGGSCFAGIETETGSWIRATGMYANGALSDFDWHMDSVGETYATPSPLDVIEIDFIGPEPKPARPENWQISTAHWKKTRVANAADAHILRHKIIRDAKIFHTYDRCVSSREIEAQPLDCSLSLVRPSALHWTPELDYYGRKRFRGEFTVSGHTYNLPLTDDGYATALAHKAEDHLANGLADPSVDLLLTISLGDLSVKAGCYHKLIAGVVELDRGCSVN
jgi:hypothetical protein